jgi:hypothetical protein
MYGPGLCRKKVRFVETSQFQASTHSYEIDSCLFGGSKERLEVKDTFGREITLLAFDQSPIDIEWDSVEPKGLNLLEDI